jgi:hypothetical protein
LVVRDPVGEPAVEHGTAPPAHSERPDRETGPGGQRAERPAAKDADAGGEPEERRRVQRDP